MPGLVRHCANAKFWEFHAGLPEQIQRLAEENYALLKADSRHPSLHFKKVGRFWSVAWASITVPWLWRTAKTSSGSGSVITASTTESLADVASSFKG